MKTKLDEIKKQIDEEETKKNVSKENAQKIENCQKETSEAIYILNKIQKKQNENRDQTQDEKNKIDTLLKEFDEKVQSAKEILDQIRNNQNSSSGEGYNISDATTCLIDAASNNSLRPDTKRKQMSKKTKNKNREINEIIIFEESPNKMTYSEEKKVIIHHGDR